MCGRYFLIAPPDEVKNLFGYVQSPDFPPRYNIAPAQPVAVVTAGRHFHLMRWGFIPAWAKDLSRLSLLFNARFEGIADKASFKHAIRRRRALVPANGYYEWRRSGRAKVPFKLALPGASLFGFAAIHETWMGSGGEELDTVAILTGEAHGLIASIHQRMPLALTADRFDGWIEGGEGATDGALDMLSRHHIRTFEPVPISSRINKGDAEGPDLHEEDEGVMRPRDLFGEV